MHIIYAGLSPTFLNVIFYVIVGHLSYLGIFVYHRLSIYMSQIIAGAVL
nr:hypothetical protein [Mucilaginibacter sp. FT3.2]